MLNLKQGKEKHWVILSSKNWTWLENRGVPSSVIDQMVSMYRLGQLVRKTLLQHSEELVKRYEDENQELKEQLKQCEMENLNLQQRFKQSKKENEELKEQLKQCEMESLNLQQRFKQSKRENEELIDNIRDLKEDLKLQKQLLKMENLAKMFEN